ncbi:MAG: pacearchaeosortase [Candidatus Pacearchaeota archaeon]|nr:pacearchaeosortase [Candidatus Pacearchaeota archaeon]
MMKKENILFLDVLIRYAVIAASIFVIPLFYFALKTPTTQVLYFIMHFFYNVNVNGNILTFFISGNLFNVEIIDACVAGSAFFLLLILNLSTKGISFIKRVYLFLFDALILFLVNIIRLMVIIPLYLQESAFFPIAHQIFWYGLSIIFVIVIWLFGTRVFRIREIPVYSDVCWLIGKSKKAQRA